MPPTIYSSTINPKQHLSRWRSGIRRYPNKITLLFRFEWEKGAVALVNWAVFLVVLLNAVTTPGPFFGFVYSRQLPKP